MGRYTNAKTQGTLNFKRSKKYGHGDNILRAKSLYLLMVETDGKVEK
jgi:hypothetical protein